VIKYKFNSPNDFYIQTFNLYLSRLSSDGGRTFLLNLDSDDLKPDGWDNLANEKPTIHSFTDISIYEMHIRDFR